MTAFISWYLILTLLGWLTFPLAYRLFPAFADRGFSLARVVGLLFWGYIFWLFASLGIAQNDAGGILLALSLLIGLSIWAFISNRQSLVDWLKSNVRMVLATEILFLVAFGFLAFTRAANPELTNAEKPMELAFISAILRSPSFPPHDPWLSGYAISYYYFGYVMTAMLARLTSMPGTVAHNLMTSLIFALSATGSYGILHNLLARFPLHGSRPAPRAPRPAFPPLLAPLFLLLVSNLEGFLEVINRRGLFLPSSPSATFNFWKWLNIEELTPTPLTPGSWIPDRYLWWWRASRVIGDLDLKGVYSDLSPIDEFPFFSFLHADLHPHVLALPFGLLAISVALHLFLGGWRGVIDMFGMRLHIHPVGFFLSALVLGGLAFLNTWDILIAAALIVFAYVLARANEDGWRWERLEDLFMLGLPLGLAAVVLYLPFYIGFSSQAGGILPNLVNPTRGAHLWVMFAPLFIPLYAWLVYLWRVEKFPANWKRGLGLGLGFALFLWLFALLLGWLASLTEPGFINQYLANQGIANVPDFIIQTTKRRLEYIGGLLSLLAILIPAIAFLFNNRRNTPGLDDAEPSIVSRRQSSIQFVLLLTFLGVILILAPEFVYLRDQFGTRLNTVFKFYYQAWMLWSIAVAFGVAILLNNLRGAWNAVFRAVLFVVLVTSLTYPVFSLMYKTNNFDPPLGYTLDAFDNLQQTNPDDAAAVKWLRTAPYGVVAEAAKAYISYQYYARFSTYSGLPAVIGWTGHESQWRGGYEVQGTRVDDMQILYETGDWEQARIITDQYDIRYICVGGLEYSTYRVSEEKFKQHLKVVFQQGSTVIYEVP